MVHNSILFYYKKKKNSYCRPYEEVDYEGAYPHLDCFYQKLFRHKFGWVWFKGLDFYFLTPPYFGPRKK